jgi:hypothetical protein
VAEQATTCAKVRTSAAAKTSVRPSRGRPALSPAFPADDRPDRCRLPPRITRGNGVAAVDIVRKQVEMRRRAYGWVNGQPPARNGQQLSGARMADTFPAPSARAPRPAPGAERHDSTARCEVFRQPHQHDAAAPGLRRRPRALPQLRASSGPPNGAAVPSPARFPRRWSE